MFVFRADRFIAMLERHQPALFAALPGLAESGSLASAESYRELPEISIDYGVLEHADNVAVVPVDMGWSDLGSWDALYEQRAKDADGNMIQGDVVAVDSRNNLLWSEHGVLAALGLENIAVVQTRDATLVCPRGQAADLKQLVSRVREHHRNLTETHLTVARPWGSYTILEEGFHYKIKRIMVNPGAKLSLQMHYHRSEHWVVIAGTAKIVNGDQEIFLEEKPVHLHPQDPPPPARKSRQDPASDHRDPERALSRRGRHRALRGHLRPRLTAAPTEVSRIFTVVARIPAFFAATDV